MVDENNPKTKAFLAKYQAQYGKGATDWSVVGYEMIKMISDPIEKCGDSKECIKTELNKVKNVDTALGNLSIEKNQEIQLKDYSLFKLLDGKFVLVK
jgi:ABC-type branched-subunit amino acid transport system substrate-binding protein